MELCASSAVPADAAAWLTGFEEWLLLFPIYVNSVYFSKMYSWEKCFNFYLQIKIHKGVFKQQYNFLL